MFGYARGPSMTGRRGLWGFQYDTTYLKVNHYKMHFRFSSAKWNAARRYSARPFTTKTGARVQFFCLNSPRNRGWYQARVHPFSSGNGKGDATTTTTTIIIIITTTTTTTTTRTRTSTSTTTTTTTPTTTTTTRTRTRTRTSTTKTTTTTTTATTTTTTTTIVIKTTTTTTTIITTTLHYTALHWLHCSTLQLQIYMRLQLLHYITQHYTTLH